MAVIIYTMAQYLAISESIAQGVTSVQYSDKTVTYRSLNDMLRIQALMKEQLFPVAGRNNSDRRYFNFSKGTNPRNRRGGGCI